MTEVDMRRVRFRVPADNRPGGSQVISIALPRGMLRELDALVGTEYLASSRSEVVRQFIREGLDRQERRAERRVTLKIDRV